MSEPVATVLLNTYQQPHFAGPALRSLLDQECEPIVIVASDDGSTDGTYEAMERVAAAYQGPHHVIVRRNERNMGPWHVPLLLSLVETPLVVRAHGDDLSRKHRVARILEVWRRTGAALIGSNAAQVDVRGRPMGLYRQGPRNATDLKSLIQHGFRPEFLGATLAYERRLVQAPFQPPDPNQVFGGLDVFLPVRAALVGACEYIDEPLIEYRRHAAQASWQITDATRDRAVFDEGLRASVIPQRLQIIRDIEALQQAEPGRQELKGAHRTAVEALLAEVFAWAPLRVALMNRGLRPHWITRDEVIRRTAAKHEGKSAA